MGFSRDKVQYNLVGSEASQYKAFALNKAISLQSIANSNGGNLTRTYKFSDVTIIIRMSDPWIKIYIESGVESIEFISGMVKDGNFIAEDPMIDGDVNRLDSFYPSSIQSAADGSVREFSNESRLGFKLNDTIFPTADPSKCQAGNIVPGMYTGKMRKIVQMILGSKIPLKYDFRFNKTHGIYTDINGDDWLVEVSSENGVIAARMPKSSKASCPSGVSAIVNSQIGYFPSGNTFSSGDQLSLDITLGKVKVLIDPSSMGGFYDKFAFYEGCGWSFSESGSSIANTCWDNGPGDGVKRTYLYRISISSSIVSGVLSLSASISMDESGYLGSNNTLDLMLFPDSPFSNHASKFSGLYNATSLSGLGYWSSPFFVYHNGEEEKIVRHGRFDFTNFCGVYTYNPENAKDPGYLSDYDFFTYLDPTNKLEKRSYIDVLSYDFLITDPVLLKKVKVSTGFGFDGESIGFSTTLNPYVSPSAYLNVYWNFDNECIPSDIPGNKKTKNGSVISSGGYDDDGNSLTINQQNYSMPNSIYERTTTRINCFGGTYSNAYFFSAIRSDRSSYLSGHYEGITNIDRYMFIPGVGYRIVYGYNQAYKTTTTSKYYYGSSLYKYLSTQAYSVTPPYGLVYEYCEDDLISVTHQYWLAPLASVSSTSLSLGACGTLTFGGTSPETVTTNEYVNISTLRNINMYLVSDGSVEYTGQTFTTSSISSSGLSFYTQKSYMSNCSFNYTTPVDSGTGYDFTNCDGYSISDGADYFWVGAA